jgi:hypothetical protein
MPEATRRPQEKARSADEDRARTRPARAPAAGCRDRHLRRRSPRASQVIPGGGRLEAGTDRDHVRSASARGTRQRGRVDHDARASAGATRLAGRRVDPRGAFHDRADGAPPRDVRRALSPDRCDCCRGGPTSASVQGGTAISICSASSGSDPEGRPGSRRVVLGDRAALREGDVGEAAALLGRPFELDGVVVAGDQRGGTLGYPTANLALEPRLACPPTGSTPARRSGTALRSRSGRTPLRRPGAPDRAVPARLRGRPLWQAAHCPRCGSGSATKGVRVGGGAHRPDRT